MSYEPSRKVQDEAERFWSKVLFGDDCWEWTGAKEKHGYGRFWWRGKTLIAHRVAWRLTHGVMPSNSACHKCDNPSCVRPDHLFEGSPADNTADMVAKGRHRSQRVTMCPAGHQYDEVNTYINGRGCRICRTCNRERSRVLSGFYERANA